MKRKTDLIIISVKKKKVIKYFIDLTKPVEQRVTVIMDPPSDSDEKKRTTKKK